jgi:hypothetical protein
MNKKYVLATVCILVFVFQACSNTPPTLISAPTKTATLSATSTSTPTPTMTPTSAPTPIPLTWKQVYMGQGFPRDKIIAFEIDSKDPDVLYVNMENAGFYQSIDSGNSWQPVQIENVPSDIATELANNNDHNQERGYTFTKVGPDGKTRLYRYSTLPTWTVSSTSNWRVSEDNGQTWSEFGLMGWPASAAATFDSEGSVYAYCDSQLCKFSPNGKQRVTLGKPEVGAFTIITISPFDSNIIYIAGQGMSVSKDGGLTWTKLNNGLGTMLLTLETGEGNPPTLYLLQMEDCDILGFPYLTSRNRGPEPGQPLYISTNGGQTWDLVSHTGCYLIKDADGVTFYRIARAIEYFGNSDSAVYWIWRSQDGGHLWQKEMVSANILMRPNTLVAHPSQSGLLYAYSTGEYESVLYENEDFSEDYGNNWKAKDPPIDAKLCYGSTLQFIDAYRPMAIDPRDGNHVFVIDNGTLLESHNSCDTTVTFATAPNTNMNSIAFDPNESDILYAGTDGGAYISYDGGMTWGQVNNGLIGSTVVYSIAVDKESNVYAATPYGVFKLEQK